MCAPRLAKARTVVRPTPAEAPVITTISGRVRTFPLWARRSSDVLDLDICSCFLWITGELRPARTPGRSGVASAGATRRAPLPASAARAPRADGPRGPCRPLCRRPRAHAPWARPGRAQYRPPGQNFNLLGEWNALVLFLFPVEKARDDVAENAEGREVT